MSRRAIVILGSRLIFSTLIAIPIYWINDTLAISATWNVFLGLAVIASVLPAPLWERLPRLPQVVGRILVFAGLTAVPLLVSWSVTQKHGTAAAFYALTVGVLFAVSLVYEQPDAVQKLAASVMGLAFALVIANVIAGMLLEDLEKSDNPIPHAAAPESESPADETESPDPTAAPEAAQLTVAESEPDANSPAENTESVDLAPTPEPTPESTPEPTPEAERPVAGFGYMEFSQDGGEAEWGYLTGYGPRVNSVARAYMVDAEGNLVYDTALEFNSKGMRGPEVSYDKPDDVYRILVIGDSFVEAIQVDYAETFYAQLQAELAKHNTANRRFEVIALGRTGWGTLQEYLYYHVEGHKFNADLVVLLFYINDVADNYPVFFYPNINNTNFDYIFEGDGVRIVDTNRETLPPKNARILFNALPEVLQDTNLARYFVRRADPPPPVLTPGGVMTRVHPQFYIYVTDPEPEGYDEAWDRTDRALTLLANEVERDGGQLIVVPVFIGAEFVQNVSTWFPELVGGWQWDDRLPEQRLSEVLDDLPAMLVPTRPVYEAYAEQVGGQVYDLIFLPEDRHFNALGHTLTKDVIYNYLVDQGVIDE